MLLSYRRLNFILLLVWTEIDLAFLTSKLSATALIGLFVGFKLVIIILSLNSKKLSIAPISPFRPRRWKGKIVSDKLKITITNLNPIKRPISAVADNLEVRNAKSIIVKTNNKIKFNLLYDKNRSLQKKIKIEQLRKETS